MPIYAYQCESCGFAKDVLQKLSDTRLTICTACGAPAFKKQLTTAGFHLKGSGWYATDFRAGSAETNETAPKAPDTPDSAAAPSPAKASDAVVPASDTAPAKGGCCAGCPCH